MRLRIHSAAFFFVVNMKERDPPKTWVSRYITKANKTKGNNHMTIMRVRNKGLTRFT